MLVFTHSVVVLLIFLYVNDVANVLTEVKTVWAEKFSRFLCMFIGHRWKHFTYHTLRFGVNEYSEC